MLTLKEKKALANLNKALNVETDEALLREIAEEEQKELQKQTFIEDVKNKQKQGLNDIINSLGADLKNLLDKEQKRSKEEQQILNQFSALLEHVSDKANLIADSVDDSEIQQLSDDLEQIDLTEPINNELMVEQNQDEKTVQSVDVKQQPESLIDRSVKNIAEVSKNTSVFQQPDPPVVGADIRDIQNKIKHLEGWLSKVSMAGPGSGEVRLEFLDDVNRDSAKVDGKFLKYDAASGKWIGADASGGGSVDEEVVVDLINDNERLVYTTSDQYRIITGYREDGEVLSIRATAIAGAHLRFELASFSPSVSATGQSLAWDQAATGFSVSVDNPTDFTERWINSVSLIDNATGVYTTLGDYTTSGPSATPAGGVDWSQTFSTNGTATIRSNGSGLSGGSASARITFKDNDDADWGTKPTISFTWGSVGHSLSFGSLSGKTFLDYYTSVGYTVSVTGFSSGANYVNTVTGSGGTPSNGSGSGTFTFTTGLHKNNNNTSRQVNLSTNFNRPAAVTGTAYTVTNAISDNTISASFSYPSFYYWTVNTLTVPTRANIVNGYGFESDVTQLGDQTKVVNGFINNTDSNPRAFWFGVRSAASQPSSFQTGPTAGLLSDTAVTTGNAVNLEPDSPLAGYIAEGYTLYGITLQPGNTYVSIS